MADKQNWTTEEILEHRAETGEWPEVENQIVMDEAQESPGSRIKNKLDLLGEDARILRENAPELYEQAREEFCEEELDERVQRLEEEVEELRDQLDDEE